MALCLASLLLFTGQTCTHRRAAGAIFRGHLERVLQFLEFLPARRGGLEGGGRVFQKRGIVNLGANHGVGADQNALAALDADLFVPHRNLERDVPFLPLGGGAGESAVDRHGADRQVVAFAGDDLGEHFLDKLRSFFRHRAPQVKGAGNLIRNLDLVQVAEGLVHGGEILLHDGFAALSVGLLDGVLDGLR